MDAAFEHLSTALERNRDGVEPYLATDPDLASLRGDPRFAELTG